MPLSHELRNSQAEQKIPSPRGAHPRRAAVRGAGPAAERCGPTPRVRPRRPEFSISCRVRLSIKPGGHDPRFPLPPEGNSTALGSDQGHCGPQGTFGACRRDQTNCGALEHCEGLIRVSGRCLDRREKRASFSFVLRDGALP